MLHVTPASQLSGASLVGFLDRAEVDDDKVFRFSRHTKTPVVGKGQMRGGGGGRMRTSTEIPQAERSIHETSTRHI